MRHNKKINHLGRTSSHRQAMLSNMASSLIKHKRIFTTTAKAKALRKFFEPLVTKSKEDTTHSRRVVFAALQDKYAVTELFTKVSEKVIDRPGGYTRIIKTGNRLGDNAAMCFIELVDFNEHMLKETKKAATKTRRSRRKSTVAAQESQAAVTTASVASKSEKKAASKALEIELKEEPNVSEVVTEIVEIAEAAPDVSEIAEIQPEEITPEKEESPTAE
jgi:large subunit ribosomal protein L17